MASTMRPMLRSLRFRLPSSTIDFEALKHRQLVTFEATPPHLKTRYLMVARPFRLGGKLFGALAVAKPTEQLRSSFVTLTERLAVAFGGGLLVALLLLV